MVKTDPAAPEAPKLTSEPLESLKHPPIIIDLGIKSRNKIEALKTCSGPLFAAVTETVDILQADGVVAENAQVVFVVVEKLVNVSDVFDPRVRR